jgi:hypothetical protein
MKEIKNWNDVHREMQAKAVREFIAIGLVALLIALAVVTANW